MTDPTQSLNEQAQVTTTDRRDIISSQFSEGPGIERNWKTLSGNDAFTVRDADSDTFQRIIIRGVAGNADQNFENDSALRKH